MSPPRAVSEEWYSTLELVEHDRSANAPEKDLGATAPEVNGSATVLEKHLDIYLSLDSNRSRANRRAEGSSCHRPDAIPSFVFARGLFFR